LLLFDHKMANFRGLSTLAISAGVGTYPAIDNLSLTEYPAVPEPAAVGWIMGAAALAAAAQRGRNVGARRSFNRTGREANRAI
jgi:hypothetical protein